MILNQTKNFMYHNTEVQELRYESTLIWKRGIPETRGLSTILYREDFDVESGTWRDTTHRKSFTSNDFGVNQNGAVSISCIGIDTIVNGVQNGFTIYTVIESSNFLNDWSQVADLNNGSDLTILYRKHRKTESKLCHLWFILLRIRAFRSVRSDSLWSACSEI